MNTAKITVTKESLVKYRNVVLGQDGETALVFTPEIVPAMTNSKSNSIAKLSNSIAKVMKLSGRTTNYSAKGTNSAA